MKVSRAVTAVSLIVLAGLGLNALVGSGHSTLAEALVDVRARFTVGSEDGRLLVRELARQIDDPLAEGQEDVLVELYLLRSEIYESLGDISSALEDVELVLDLYRPKNPTLELRAAVLEAAGGSINEALARARNITRRANANAEVFSTIGLLERTLAITELDAAEAQLRLVMVGSEADSIAATLAELCARDPIDRDRRQLADAIKTGLPAGQSELVKVLLDRAEVASGHNRAARIALATALNDGSDAGSARQLIDLLREAGHAGLAVDLALAVGLSPGLRDDPGVFESTLDALLGLGHSRRATQLVREWSWRNNRPSAELCEKALELLLEQGQFRQMGPVISALRATQQPGLHRIVSFYQALQTSDRAGDVGSTRQWESALRRWDDFMSTQGTRSPVPGGWALAHIQRAAARRALGDTEGEREDLLRAITPPLSAAKNVWFRYVTADDYMRISELSGEVNNTGYRGPEERWTHAMSLAPELWADLYPRWTELGHASLQKGSGFTFAEVYDSAQSSGGSFPLMDVGPQTLYEVGREHLRLEQTQGAVIVARHLLSTYPGLIPAYDLMIEAQLSRGSRVQVTVDLLDRLELTGPDEITNRYLSDLGENVLRPPQRLEWMRLDPRRMGRRILATHALARGKPLQALRALGPTPADPTAESATQRLLRAEALLELDRPDEVLLVLGRMDQRQLHGDDALRLQLLATCAGLEPTHLEEVVARMVARLALDDPPREAALQAVGTLLSTGRSRSAGELLAALDARRETRGGPVLEAMTLHALLLGDRAGALEALERSEAFFEDGRVELRRLIIAIDDRNWRRLPAMAVATRAALGDGIDPWLEAALLLLEERLTAATELARAGMDAHPRTPQWALLAAAAGELTDQRQPLPPSLGPAAQAQARAVLNGREDSGLDPREVIGLVIATEFAGWAPSVPAACDALRERGAGELWPSWLTGRSLEVQARKEDALAAFRELSTEYPSFGPAWDGWERCLNQRDAAGWGPERLRLCAGRAEADAGQQAGAVHEAIDQACRQYRGGDRDAALATLEEVYPEDRKQVPVPLARLVAHLHQVGGDLRQAAAALESGLPRSARRSDDPLVAELVAVLVAASDPKVSSDLGLSPSKVETKLAHLIEQFPQDPLPVLAWCRLRTEVERRNPAVVVDVISGAFESLRARTSGSTLDSLRPDSAREWGEFLLEIAPDVAESFLLEDLASTPGDLELWRHLALTVDRQGRTNDAADLHAAVVTMSNDPRAHLGYAWFLLEHGGSIADVTAQLEMAQEAADDDPIDPAQLSFVSALAQVRLTDPRNLSALVNELEDIWNRREELREVSTLLLGRAYVAALVQRLQPQDRRRLDGVLEELEKASEVDPYVADLARATRALVPSILRGSQVRQRRESPPGARDAGEEDAGDAEPAPERRGGGGGGRKRDRGEGGQEAGGDEARGTRGGGGGRNRRRDRDEDEQEAGGDEAQGGGVEDGEG